MNDDLDADDGDFGDAEKLPALTAGRGPSGLGAGSVSVKCLVLGAFDTITGHEAARVA
jgi:hypothetical protein